MKITPKTKMISIKAVERAPRTVSNYKYTAQRMLEENESPDAYAADVIFYGTENALENAKSQLDGKIKLAPKSYSNKEVSAKKDTKQKQVPHKTVRNSPKKTQTAKRNERQMRESIARRTEEVVRAIVAKLKGENALLIFACLLAVLLAVILVCASSMLLGEMGYVSSA